MDCIVLAGDRENYRKVANEDNKAFLPIAGQTILHHILNQLVDVTAVERILLVGPCARFAAVFDDTFRADYPKPLLFFPQAGNLVDNILATVAASAAESASPDPQRLVLVIPSDIPLVTSAELNQFVDRCDMQTYDYVGGVTSSEVLSRFGASAQKPGVSMATFRLNSGSYRISNLHLVRPAAVKRGDYIRQTYALRYQKRLANIAKMWLALIGLLFRAPTAPVYYLAAQFARHAKLWGWPRVERVFASFVTLARAERYISSILGTRFKIVETDFGGAAVDVDNDRDYETISSRFEEWRAMQLRR